MFSYIIKVEMYGLLHIDRKIYIVIYKNVSSSTSHKKISETAKL